MMVAHELPNRERKKESISKESVSQVETVAPNQLNSAAIIVEDGTLDLRNDKMTGQPNGQKDGSLFGLFKSKRQTTDEDSLRGPLGLRLLHSSPRPLIDLIFVHGLRGGSVKTWRKGNNPRTFWPKYWLPMEADLCNASIHSFGYDSDYATMTPSILNVHDFGQALYEEMKSSPQLRQKPNEIQRPIILIGHSMGGLVIKKAFILAHQDIGHQQQLAKRIRCIFFLATPHRGADYASLLNAILSVSGFSSSRKYISDLTRGSTSAQLINEDFGRLASDLRLYSFYETLPTILGSSLIVEKDSALLGPGFKEESCLLNANHREICKFDSPGDSNYLSLKNHLTGAVQDLLEDVIVSHDERIKLELHKLQKFLGVSPVPDVFHEKLEGSCKWLDERDDFKEWRQTQDAEDLDPIENKTHSPSLYWVNANPGAGKTVLASHVMLQLQESRLQYSFCYFKAGKRASQSLAYFLRSIAYQMATSNTVVCNELVKLCNESSTFDLDDARAIWSKIFRAGILKIPIFKTQYWVIDAIDECAKYPDFFNLLKGIKPPFPLRIFITSRRVPEMEKFVLQLQECRTSIVEIPTSDIMSGIALFVHSQIEILQIDSEEQKQELTTEILSKSGACFLWVKLVMEELQTVYGFESMMSIVRGIPDQMTPYYKRRVEDMGENKREKHIIKAILLWVTCSARPLSILELSEALRLDIKVRLPSAKSAIEGLCGHLVTVDKQSFVNIVHLTAREFLSSKDAGEFKISSAEAHERIALACLELLASPAMQPLRNKRLVGQKRPGQVSSPLLDYAIEQFSEHIFGASAESDTLLEALNKFLSTTVLTWIEKIVARKFLHHLIRTSRNLRAFLDRRAMCQSPLNRYVSNINNWVDDLSRLATKFGSALMSQPQSIYFLIPPLCPTETAIYRQFGRSSDGLIVSGFKNADWDDCVATINFGVETAAAVACDNNFIAVGFESGDIYLYNHSSFQKERVIKHGAPVDLLLLDPLGSFLVSSCIKHLTAWDLEGNLLWQKRLRSRCIVLTSSSEFIAGVTMSGRTFRWDIATGEQIDVHQYPYEPFDRNSQLQADLVKAPSKAAFGPRLELLALAFRNGPTCIYELENHNWIAWATDGNPRQLVVDLVFNPNPEVPLLLVAYDDSHLVLFDSWSGTLVQSYEPENHVILTSLSCSTDGRTFATVDVLGNLQIWDFETLTGLYYIQTPTHSFRILGFTSDGFGVVDIVDQEMKIWSPAALVRKTMEEGSSISEQAAILPTTKGQFMTIQSSKIRSTVVHETLTAVFVGNYHGDVSVFNTANSDSEDPMTVLYSHHRTVVKCLAVSHEDIIASGDVNGRVQVWQLDTRSAAIQAIKLRFHVRLNSAICQLLFDCTGEYLLISTTGSDHVYAVISGALVGSLTFDEKERSIWKWTALSDAKHIKQFTLISNHELTTYPADTFPTNCTGDRVLIDYEIADGFVETGIDCAVLHQHSMLLILDLRQRRGYETVNSLLIFKLPDLSTGGSTVTLQPLRTLEASVYTHFLGISEAEQRLVYIGRNSWVSSIDLKSLSKAEDLQHFFVPSEFITSSNNILPMQTVDDKFVFCMYDKLAVVKNGLVFKQSMSLE